MEPKLIIGPFEIEAIKESARREYHRVMKPDNVELILKALIELLERNEIEPGFEVKNVS